MYIGISLCAFPRERGAVTDLDRPLIQAAGEFAMRENSAPVKFRANELLKSGIITHNQWLGDTSAGSSLVGASKAAPRDGCRKKASTASLVRNAPALGRETSTNRVRFIAPAASRFSSRNPGPCWRPVTPQTTVSQANARASGRIVMSKHDESRRAFLVGAVAGAAAGAGAVATAAVVSNQQAQTPPETGVDPLAYGARQGAFLNADDAATVAALAERIMPGAPGMPGATDAGGRRP